MREFVHSPTIQANNFSVANYVSSLLAFAEPALKYGAANCDGYTAVALKTLLESDFSKNFKNIAICSIDEKHVFLAINIQPLGDKKQFVFPLANTENCDAIIFDAYENSIKPFPAAVTEWKEKQYHSGNVVCHALIEQPFKNLISKNGDIKQILRKLDKAAGNESRHQGRNELDQLCRHFSPGVAQRPNK